MLIWRVIYDDSDWYNNCPNDFVARYLLVSAEKRSSPYTTGAEKQEVPFPGKNNVTTYAPFTHNKIENIQEQDGVITCDFVTTTMPSSLEDVTASDDDKWYNLMGQPIDTKTYKGIAISRNKKYLLR
jgi:hypothetical protein